MTLGMVPREISSKSGENELIISKGTTGSPDKAKTTTEIGLAEPGPAQTEQPTQTKKKKKSPMEKAATVADVQDAMATMLQNVIMMLIGGGAPGMGPPMPQMGPMGPPGGAPPMGGGAPPVGMPPPGIPNQMDQMMG